MRSGGNSLCTLRPQARPAARPPSKVAGRPQSPLGLRRWERMREAIAIEAALEGRRASWWSHKVAYGAGCRAVDNGCGSCRGISEVTMRTDTTCTANTTRGLVQRAHGGTHKHYYMRVRASCTPFFPPRNAVNESNGQSSEILACIASRNCPGGSSREATSSSRPKLSEAYRGCT